MKKTLLIVFIAFVSTLIIALIILNIYLSTDRISTILNDQLGDEFKVEIEFGDFNAFTRVLKIEGLLVLAQTAEHVDTLLIANHFSIGPIGFIQAIRGNVSLGKLSLEDFTFFESNLPKDDSEDKNSASAGTLIIHRINLHNGTVHFSVKDDGKGEINEINLNGGHLTLKPDKNPFISIETLDIESIKYTFWDDRYTLSVDSLSLNEKTSRFFVRHLNLNSNLSEVAFFESQTYRNDLVEFDLEGLLFEGFNISSLFENQELITDVLSVDTFDLHITANLGVEQKPVRSKKTLPVVNFQNLDIPIAIDSLVVKYADIRYSEQAEDGVRPGTVHFGKTYAIVTNLNNRSTEPIVLKANTFLENTGEIETEIRLTNKNVTVKGSMKEFDIKELNSIFMDLVGVEIRDGMVHSLSFDFEMQELDSFGVMHIFYDDLKIAQINKDDHKQNLGKRITGFLVNEVVMRESSRNHDTESRQGEISFTREPEKGFFSYLWVSLRTGIFDIVI